MLRPLMALLPAALAAQDFVWKLPPRGLAEWRREHQITTQVLETTESPAPGKNPDLWLWHGPLNPPLLFESELTADRSSLQLPPRDLRDLAMSLAFDLRRAGAGKRKLVVPRIVPFGDLHLAVRIDKPLADGTQTIVAELVRAPVEPQANEQQIRVRAWFDRLCQHDLEARITITRTLDPGRGVVAGFEATFAGRIAYAEGQPRRKATFQITEKWTFVRTLENRGGDFNARVETAIRKGAAWLEGKLANPKLQDVAATLDGDGRSFGSGRLALCVKTLLEVGGDPNKPPLAGALDELRRRELTDTYSLGAALMAIDALYSPPHEREQLLDGRLPRPPQRKLPPADLALVREWAARLLQNQDQRVDPATRRRWNYLPAARYDNSVSQYALLGLYSAALCGAEIPTQVFAAAATHFLETQKTERGDGVLLQLVSHREQEQRAHGGTRTVGSRRTPLGGWWYGDGDERSPSGSMTAAGITGLTICEAMLEQRRGPVELLGRCGPAIRSGFAWLAQNLTVRCNPGHAEAWPHWRYYWLYSLERACELSRVALIQDRDWYFEGASLLLALQDAAGEFATGNIDGTCLAVLFLKKAALPVYTGEGR